MPIPIMNRWQSPVGFDCSEWASDLSITASRPTRAVIPVGTVASRIIDLQKIAKSSTYNEPASMTSHCRESSKIGFGRRTTARFGQPASRSSRPDEQPEVDIQHAFLGLAARRNNHMDEHAAVDGRARLDRTAGLHAQRVSNEVTNPWAILPSGQSKKDTLRQNKRFSHSADDPATLLDGLRPVPVQSSSTADGAAEKGVDVTEKESCQTSNLWARPRDPHQQRPEPSSESFSTRTTSTMRRQSVRDLYAYYGIRRPPGLVSSEGGADDPKYTPESARKFICCHVCFWFNSLKSTYCKCGHQICAACEGILSDTGTRSSRSIAGTESTLKPRYGHVESKTVSDLPSEPKIEVRVLKQGKLPHGLFPAEELHDGGSLDKTNSVRGQGRCDLKGSAPTPRVEEATHRCAPGKRIMACKEIFDSAAQNQELCMNSRDRRIITTSTLLSTDALLPGYSLGLLPVAMSMAQSDEPSRCKYHLSRLLHHESQSNARPHIDIHESTYCGEKTCCKETISGHARHREHSCQRERQAQPDETDSEYAVGVSHHNVRDAMEPESCFAQEDLRLACPDYGGFKQNTRPTAAPGRAAQLSKQAHSSSLYQKCTCSLGYTPSLLPHTDIHMPLQAEQSHNGDPVRPDSICSKQQQNQCIHDLSRCTHYDGRCHGNSIPQSLSSSHTVRLDQHLDSFRMALQSQNCAASPKKLPEKLPSEKTDRTGKSIASLTSQKGTPERLGTGQVLNAESKEAPAQGMRTACGQQFSKETFKSLKEKFENEKSELEAARPSKAASHYLISQADQSPEPKERLKLPKRPSNESLSSTINQPSGICSSHKSKSTTRRLSAFFRLQEQNIVSTLNKRLQEHQEALKRMDSLCNDQLNLVRRGDSLIAEEGGQHGIQRRDEEQLARSCEDLVDQAQDRAPSPREERKMRNRRWQEDQETTGNEKRQEVILLGLDTPKIVVETQWDGEDRHQWKRMVVRSTARTVESPVRVQEERFVNVNGITITIHMDGREDIVIKADLTR